MLRFNDNEKVFLLMRILELHCDYFAQKPRYKALKSMPELSDEEKAGYRVEEVLVVFTSVEEGDDSSIVMRAAAEIKKNFDEVKAKTVFVNPYAHLSSSLAKPDKAQQILYELWQEVRKFAPDAKKGVFGYYKEFELKCKGHPLSELSKTISNLQFEKVATSGALPAKEIASAKKQVAKPELLQFVVPPKEHADKEAVARNTAQLLVSAVLAKMSPSNRLAGVCASADDFFVDLDTKSNFSEADLEKISKEIQKLIDSKAEIKESKISAAKAKELFKGNAYKEFLLDSISKESEVFVANVAGHNELVSGPVLDNAGKLAAFKLTKAGGAYWLDDAANKQLQRISGVGFSSKEKFDAFEALMEEASRRDHRKIGKDLKIFMFAEEVGMGLPLWMPNGETLRHLLVEYMRTKEEKYGYKYVQTPAITKASLYFASGHLPHYAESMYAPIDIEGSQYYLKPMNCPHHHMMFKEMVTSYRDLPLRFAEPGTCYRYELSGTMYGLIRARCFTQNDSHIYVTPSQVEQEFVGVLKLFKETYGEMGIKDYWYRLSLPDFEKNPEKYGGAEDIALWDSAANQIRKAMKSQGEKYVEEKGEAAFYGPKIDVQIRNAMGKEDSIATIQIDIVVPKRMGLTYINDKGEKERVVIIHRAILGSYERFIAFLLEQYAGNLPTWLSPVQVAVLPITDEQQKYARQLVDGLLAKGVRAELDTTQEKIEHKIRSAQMMKIPYMLVIGKKEEESKTVSVRTRKGDVKNAVNTVQFEKELLEEIEQKKK